MDNGHFAYMNKHNKNNDKWLPIYQFTESWLQLDFQTWNNM